MRLSGAGLLMMLALALSPARSDDTELRDIDVTGWPCLNQPSGTAKTPDGVERNAMKNRAPVSLERRKIEELDTAGFLKKVAAYDVTLRAQRRSQLGGPQKGQLSEFEDQIVSLTGYLVLAYPGPAETTNCGDRRFHDWHLGCRGACAKHLLAGGWHNRLYTERGGECLPNPETVRLNQSPAATREGNRLSHRGTTSTTGQPTSAARSRTSPAVTAFIIPGVRPRGRFIPS